MRFFDIQMYYLAKVSGEQTARQFGLENGIEVVTIAASLVAGPFLTPTLPASIEEALAVVTGVLVLLFKLMVIKASGQ